MPRPSLAGGLASNLETHVECVPRPRQWGGFPATKPARMPLFYSGADKCGLLGRHRHPQMLQLPLAARQTTTDLAQRMRPAQLAEQHGHELTDRKSTRL